MTCIIIEDKKELLAYSEFLKNTFKDKNEDASLSGYINGIHNLPLLAKVDDEGRIKSHQYASQTYNNDWEILKVSRDYSPWVQAVIPIGVFLTPEKYPEYYL